MKIIKLIRRNFISTAFLYFFGILFCGCGQPLLVKENLSEGQVVELRINRKMTREKSLGVMPRYDDHLEGYVRGGLMDSRGRPIQGVVVSVVDEKGRVFPEFVPGVTDNLGIYKIRFSLPILWNRIDFAGHLSCAGWRAVTPQSRFRLYFDRKQGILAYSSKEVWLTVETESSMGEAKPGSKFLPSFAIKEKPLIPIPAPSAVETPKTEEKKDDFGFGP